jgi:predicted O-methyltransferase YrrM
MKMHQSKILENIGLFKSAPTANQLMRDHDGMYLVWKVIEYFRPKHLLEIGSFKGQTLGIMMEAAGPDAKLVSVDINCQCQNLFEELFPGNTVKFIEIDSNNLTLDKKFDFIMIDGDHTYDGALNDLKKCLPLMHNETILCMDDYHFFDGVAQVVEEHLLGQHDFVPFLCGLQQMFFCHSSRSMVTFMNDYLINDATDFFQFDHIDFHKFRVLKSQIYSRAILEDSKIFQSILEFYDL